MSKGLLANGANGMGPLGTAKDLTFVSVLDKDGRPLRQASTVEVWNTHKNNIRTYPIIGKDINLFLNIH